MIYILIESDATGSTLDISKRFVFAFKTDDMPIVNRLLKLMNYHSFQYGRVADIARLAKPPYHEIPLIYVDERLATALDEANDILGIKKQETEDVELVITPEMFQD